jgi:paraquat-inducible protein A
MAFSTLITLFWAVTLPILDIDVLGISRKISLLDSFFILLDERHFLTAVILLFSVIVIPVTMLFIIVAILLHILFKISVKKVSFLFRCYEHIKEWNMIEVYLVSVLVSMIKLNDVSEMAIDNGLWFFMIYLLFFYITLKFFNSHDIWHKELYERY